MKQIAALIGFSVLVGAEWLREFLVIPQTPQPLRSAIALTAAALICAALPSQRKVSWAGVLVGMALFAVPVALLSFVRVSGFTTATLWTLAPVFIVVLCGARGAGLRQDLLFIALAGTTGALLIFPVQFPASLTDSAGWAVVLLAIVSASAGAVFARQAIGLATSGVGAAAAVLWIIALSGRLSLTRPELLWIAAIDLPALLLLFWLFQIMQPEALAARYLLPLVVTIVTSWLALHQQMSSRFAMGLVLLLTSSILLVWKSRKQPVN